MGGGEGAFPAGEEATRGEHDLTAQAQHLNPTLCTVISLKKL